MAKVSYDGEGDRRVIIVELDAAYEAMAVGPLQELSDLLLHEVEQADTPRLVLDMAKTNYIDSMFIEVIFRAWKRIKEQQGGMAVCGANQVCGDVLRITKLDQIWPVCDTRDEAIEKVRAA